MSLWLITVAMAPEARLLTTRWQVAGDIGRRPCWRGSLAGRDTLLLLTGIGQVNAAQAVTAALEAEPGIEAVFNLGCAGAFEGSGLRIGQAALASEVVLADMGVQSAGAWRAWTRWTSPWPGAARACRSTTASPATSA